MDNAAHDLEHLISQHVQAQFNHRVNSPELINRTVGEAMRHIGTVLAVSSSTYLPLRNEEIMVQPEKLSSDTNDALVLIKRSIISGNSFMLLVDRQIVEGVESFVLFGYKPDDFNLANTQFINFDEVARNELIRQLRQIVTSNGSVLVQCVILKDFFKDKPVDNSGLFSSDVEKAEPSEPILTKKPATQVEISMLPPVNPDALL